MYIDLVNILFMMYLFRFIVSNFNLSKVLATNIFLVNFNFKVLFIFFYFWMNLVKTTLLWIQEKPGLDPDPDCSLT